MSSFLLDNGSPEFRGKRIRFVREHLLAFTREQFCQGSSITCQSLKGWELAWGGGLSKAGALRLIKQARQFNIYCTDSWLMYGVGRPATIITKDLDIQENDESHIAKELLTFRELPDSIDTVVRDDCMIPFFYPGNYVGGIIAHDTENAIGKECIIVADNDEVFVRILLNGEEQNRYNLTCLNHKTTSVKKIIKDTSIKFAAPIIWIRRIFRETDCQ